MVTRVSTLPAAPSTVITTNVIIPLPVQWSLSLAIFLIQCPLFLWILLTPTFHPNLRSEISARRAPLHQLIIRTIMMKYSPNIVLTMSWDTGLSFPASQTPPQSCVAPKVVHSSEVLRQIFIVLNVIETHSNLSSTHQQPLLECESDHIYYKPILNIYKNDCDI